MIAIRKIVEGRTPAQRRASLALDVGKQVRKGAYDMVHVVGMDYGGGRDFELMYAQPVASAVKVPVTYSKAGMSEDRSGSFRPLDDPRTGKFVPQTQRSMPAWGAAIPRDARHLLYLAWEDQTGASGYSARSGPISLAYYMYDGAIPEGDILLAVDVDGGGRPYLSTRHPPDGFAPFAARRLYYPSHYTGFGQHLQRLAAQSGEWEGLVRDLEQKNLMRLFAERKPAEPPFWSYDDLYQIDMAAREPHRTRRYAGLAGAAAVAAALRTLLSEQKNPVLKEARRFGQFTI